MLTPDQINTIVCISSRNAERFFFEAYLRMAGSLSETITICMSFASLMMR